SGAAVAWGALDELQQAPMATAQRASGTPTPGQSARADRKRDGIPWHSPLTQVVKGALYRVFWTTGINRRLQVQHPFRHFLRYRGFVGVSLTYFPLPLASDRKLPAFTM